MASSPWDSIKRKDPLCTVQVRKTNNQQSFSNLKFFRTCADERNQDQCTHSEEERAIVGVYVSTDIYYALDNGYRVLDVYESYIYPRHIQYDGRHPGNVSQQGLFNGYEKKL